MNDTLDLQQLSIRESEQVEWKENVADIESVVATLSAFANDLPNLGGGYVVCGAREAKDEHGFPRLERIGLTADRLREVEGRVLQRCRDRVSPSIAPRVEELAADGEERRILVFVQPATGHAHTFRSGSDGPKHYVRVGRSTVEARNGLFLELMVRSGAVEPWDVRPCDGATVDDIDLVVLQDTLVRMKVSSAERDPRALISADVQLSPFAPTLCVREPLTGLLRPRNFAILLFGRDVQRFIPGAVSLLSVYPGKDRSESVARRHELAGTILNQAQRLQELLEAQIATLFDKEDIRSPNVLNYPARALLEGMINVIVHRDYSMHDPTRITAFVDRVEMVSPGRLPLGIDLAALRRGRAGARWRNRGLAWFFNRLNLAQAEGQGINVMRREMKLAGCPPPRFAADEARVTCTLRANPRFVKLAPLAEILPRARGRS